MENGVVDRPTPRQIRGARGMLNWSMMDLAKASGVSISTVKRAEQAAPEAVSDDALHTLQAALEGAGVSFLDDPGEGEGLMVRLGT